MGKNMMNEVILCNMMQLIKKQIKQIHQIHTMYILEGSVETITLRVHNDTSEDAK